MSSFKIMIIFVRSKRIRWTLLLLNNHVRIYRLCRNTKSILKIRTKKLKENKGQQTKSLRLHKVSHKYKVRSKIYWIHQWNLNQILDKYWTNRTKKTKRALIGSASASSTNIFRIKLIWRRWLIIITQTKGIWIAVLNSMQITFCYNNLWKIHLNL